jgi:hypothetical protein
MSEFISALTKLALIVMGIVLAFCGAALLFTVLGGTLAAVVEYFLGPLITGTIQKISGVTLSPFEVGGTLGFMSAFFRNVTTARQQT